VNLCCGRGFFVAGQAVPMPGDGLTVLAIPLLVLTDALRADQLGATSAG
jgi:hypothetical protein